MVTITQPLLQAKQSQLQLFGLLADIALYAAFFRDGSAFFRWRLAGQELQGTDWLALKAAALKNKVVVRIERGTKVMLDKGFCNMFGAAC